MNQLTLDSHQKVLREEKLGQSFLRHSAIPGKNS